jgi:hypothetical protein
LVAGLAFLGYYPPPSQATSLLPGVGLVCCVLCLAFASGIEVVVLAVRRRRYWGWVAGACYFTLYIPTVFLPLGALGLWALLAPATRALFGVGPLTSVSRRPGSSSMASVAFRLLLLTIALTAVAIAYVRISGVGMPPYHPVPEPSELERVHRLVGLALFAVAALSAASLASAFVAVILVQYRRRAS